jgi:hypothetical protein
MSTEAQVAANRANAEQSTGPKTEEGKAASSHNRASHGLSYVNTYFFLLPFESSYAYDNLLMDLRNEHSPMTRTEDTLVERMAQHQWLRCRAEFFEAKCFDESAMSTKSVSPSSSATAPVTNGPFTSVLTSC